MTPPARAVLPVPAHWHPALLDRLREALDGVGPALLPVPDREPGRTLLAVAHADEPVDDDVALLLPTSGSTGTPKVVELPTPALHASAVATAARLGGHGRWLLALPLTHVAGWQVLVRSVVAGTVPTVLDAGRPFDAAGFAAATERLGSPRGPDDGSPDGRRYTALVPTQLGRLLDDPAGRTALRRYDAVLVGGAATAGTLLARAADAGARVVTTYGMTETSGGCVYDGVPLDGVRVRLDGGRVLLSGPVLARRYRGDPALTAETFGDEADGVRWFRTSDAGRVDGGSGTGGSGTGGSGTGGSGTGGSGTGGSGTGEVTHGGRLVLAGRVDDVLVSGGANVHPGAVERVVASLDGVADVVVVGVPDPQWGQAVVALVAGPAVPGHDAVRAAVTQALGREHAPRRVLAVDTVPLLGIGKPDRTAAARLAAELLLTERSARPDGG